MSIHLGAKLGQIAPTVLLPGDPLRAKHIAETMLEDLVCYNEVRGMLGYPGHYKGKRVSVMGGGIGIPTQSIYVHELLTEYHPLRSTSPLDGMLREGRLAETQARGRPEAVRLPLEPIT